ncbi:type II secretion system F family protein [Alkalimarinus coralli]|uniref:type II secretion system F family protein n=1 Tax=Alkalimarinus coralli TaxID=2935863 RepID=UPI00202B0657|nr:type II secretion system F family protein [Alkalimarinus coralli]
MNVSFQYVAVDERGSEVTGDVSASSEREAVSVLWKQSLTVLDIKEKNGEGAEEGPGRKRLKQQDLITSLFELSSMLNAGVSAAEAVASQAQASAHQRLRWAYKQASKTLRHGGSFEQAMEASKLALPDYVYYLIRAGEVSGTLGAALSDACDQMQYDMTVQNDTRNALIYPAILVVSGVLAVLMMFVYVVPSFTNLLEESERLPWLAWAVLSSGKWANENFILLTLALLLPPVLLVGAWMQPRMKIQMLALIEKAPIVGEWISHADVAAWSKVLSSLVRNRVELIMAMELAAESVRMPSRKRSMLKAKGSVKAGGTLSAALESNNCLTATGYNLVRVGERSGKLEAMLNALASLYTEQGQQRMKKVLILIEPVAILVIGIGMGTIIIGIMLAITSANDIPL